MLSAVEQLLGLLVNRPYRVDREEDNGRMNIQTELGGDLPVLSVFKRTEIEAYRRHR